MGLPLSLRAGYITGSARHRGNVAGVAGPRKTLNPKGVPTVIPHGYPQHKNFHHRVGIHGVPEMGYSQRDMKVVRTLVDVCETRFFGWYTIVLRSRRYQRSICSRDSGLR